MKLFCIALFSSIVLVPLANARPELKWDVDDILNGPGNLFAIGHRGYGANRGENENIPLENSLESIRKAYKDGMSMVEIDVNFSGDGKVVVIHDDYIVPESEDIENRICLNTLDYDQIVSSPEAAPQLHQALQVARGEAHNAETVSGQLFVEIKTPSPLCDPEDVTSDDLVRRVVEEVVQSGMESQVILQSFSPEQVYLASLYAPNVQRTLLIDALNLTPIDVIEAGGVPVEVLEDKDEPPGFGLRWANIGNAIRGVGYTSLEQIIDTALDLGATCVGLDKRILFQPKYFFPELGADCDPVQLIKNRGLCVTAYTAVDGHEWDSLAITGVDGIFTDDIPYSAANQDL